MTDSPAFLELKNNLEGEILKDFDSIRKVFYENKNNFLDLPHQAIYLIVKNNNLMIDSEASVFYLVACWIEKDLAEREKYFQQLIEPIRFSQMEKPYLLWIVPNLLPYFRSKQNPPIGPMMGEEYLNKRLDFAKKAVENEMCPRCIGQIIEQQGKEFAAEQLKRRPCFTAKSNQISVKCVFNNIKQLTPAARYYSAPLVSNGYEFYYFIRLQKTDPNASDSPENFKLAGYLRCVTKIPNGTTHRLPVSTTVKVAKKSEGDRVFKASSVIFEASEKAIGGILMLEGENWEQVENDGTTINCPIIINDTMTVTATIELLPEEDGCVVISEIL